METMKLTLEYIKVLIWPLVLIFAFAFYGNQLFSIIENREIDAFGLSIGRQIDKQLDDINNNNQAQLNELKKTIKTLTNNSELIAQVEGIQKNVSKQISNVRKRENFEQLDENANIDRVKAKSLEKNGFEAIINREINTAVNLFEESSQLWPEHNNVKEIARLLNQQQAQLKNKSDPTAWKTVYRKILNQYSWGMPERVRDEMKTFVGL
jgi:hypothetical protein